MSPSAAGTGGAHSLRFWDTTSGKKAVMAASGVILSGFVLVHLVANLQIFLGPEAFNGYARTLRRLPLLLWGVRILLLVSFVLHIWSSIQLAVIKAEARPVSYTKRVPVASSYASRTMYYSGPILGAFVVYHLMQFTFGAGGTRYAPSDPYGNVVAGFRVPWISLFYVISMGLLCLHLRHGLWSFLQTLGLFPAGVSPRLKTVATTVALLVFLGFISIPVAVLAGLIQPFL